MSSKADDIWRNVMTVLLQQIELERQNAVASQTSIPLQQSFYATYLNAYQQLEECYALLEHPQKRLVVRRALDAVVARLCECRQLLCEGLNDPFPDMFQMLSGTNKLPQEIAVPIPRYATADRPILLQRNWLMKTLVEKFNAFDKNGSLWDKTHTLPNYEVGTGLVEVAEQQSSTKMSLAEAILLLQKTERGRNARVRANLFRSLERNRPEAKQQREQIVNREAAATALQRYWRGILRARRANEKKQAELVFLGIAEQSVHGRSLLPLIGTQIDKATASTQRQLEQQRDVVINTQIEVLQKSLYQQGKTSIETLALPHFMRLALCPTSCADAATCDPLESTYALCRIIDRQNIVNNQALMKKDVSNITNSAFPLAPDSIKRLLLRRAAEFMVSDAYQNILARRRVGAIIHTNRAIYDADRDAVAEEVALDEAEELKAELRKRHWAAINDFIYNKQIEDPEDPNTNVNAPAEPLHVETLEEFEMMEQVKKDEDALADAQKKKKAKKAKKTKKGKKDGDEDEDEAVDESVKQLSAFMTDLVDATVEYFIHWQRHEDKPGMVYDDDFVKELFRPKAFRDVFEQVWNEVKTELEQMAKNADLIVSMEGKKKKGKKGKKGKGKKGKKGKAVVYVPPAPTGPVGDEDTEKAFAELVAEGIIKLPKPATFGDIVAPEQFFSPASKQTLLMKRQAEEALGVLKDVPEEVKKSKEVEEEATALMAPLSLSNIRSCLIHTVVLPMANTVVRPFVVRPQCLLIFGAPGCGKSLFTRAIATETGAMFFDLSPANLIAKFPAADVEYLFSLVKQVLFVNQPAVVYIDEVELVIGADKKKAKKKAGKKGKGDDGETRGATMTAAGYPKTADPSMNPSRIKKQLAKLIKSVAPTDGIVFVGNSSLTFGREKGLADFFDQMIYIPLPDYSTRVSLISYFIQQVGLVEYSLTGVAKDMRILQTEAVQKGEAEVTYSALGLIGLQRGTLSAGVGTGKFFDLSALARATDGFTAGQIERVIFETLTPVRIASLGQRPLDAQEFGTALGRQIPQNDSTFAHDILFGLNKVPARKEKEVDAKKPKK